MKHHPSALLFGLVLAFSCRTAESAEPPAIARTEINYLLGFIERSGCQFYRNGSWYDSQRAQEHLRTKYDFMVARDLIKTAEDFIEQAATKSSMSGIAYALKCSGAPVVASGLWLREVLARYRSTAARAAVETRDAH
ncbi:MAG TPA: DUF5329 domain-containing protein [Steroidobacteraceae bacterium]|nr:DUF5329 domain-containing protein [Steroidobacteraceae bacterium]